MPSKYFNIRTGSYAEKSIDIVAQMGTISGPTLAARLGISVYEMSNVMRKPLECGYLVKNKSCAPGHGNINLFSPGPVLTPEAIAAAQCCAEQSEQPEQPGGKVVLMLPARGSRQWRVIEALSKYPKSVQEADLMAAHGLDGLDPTKWRQGPYKSLKARGLITRVTGGFNNSIRWALTNFARELMLEAVTPAAPENLIEEKPLEIVPPRTAPPFRPLKLAPCRVPYRPGSWDFRNIPSVYAQFKGASAK